MFWRIRLNIVTMLSILVTFTAGFGMPQSSLDSVTITEKDNMGEVQIELGGILTVKLESTPGTGYTWRLVRNDPGLLKQMGEPLPETRLVDPKKKIVGAPEDLVFRFRAQGKGSNILSLEYLREFEKKAAPLKTFSVTVQIN